MKMSIPIYADILNISQDCLFWKDKDRRFVGVNQAFLDFYGFAKYFDDIECYGNNLKSKGDNIALLAKRNGLEKAYYIGVECGSDREHGTPSVPLFCAVLCCRG